MVSINLGEESHDVSSLNKNVFAHLVVYPLNSHEASVPLGEGVCCQEARLLVETLLEGIEVYHRPLAAVGLDRSQESLGNLLGLRLLEVQNLDEEHNEVLKVYN